MEKQKANVSKKNDRRYWIGSRTSPEQHVDIYGRQLKDIYVLESEDGIFKPFIQKFDFHCVCVLSDWLKFFDYKAVNDLVRLDLKNHFDAYFDEYVPKNMISGYMKKADAELYRICLKKVEEVQQNANKKIL